MTESDIGEEVLEADSSAIEVKSLTKAFGKQLALREVDLQVKRGAFLTLFGPNGAGKTTLIKVLATLLRPTTGIVRICGLDLSEYSIDIRREIGLVSHQPLLYDDLTAYENLQFWGRMYDVQHLAERIHNLVAMVGLSSRLHDRVRTFSRGMQQRISIVRALIHNPSVILLDEPETGLDRYASSMLKEILQSLNAEGRTVVMTTHNLETGLEMGNEVAILAGGRVVYQEPKRLLSLANLQEAYHRYTGATV
ncbi:MAG: heme ABC exporter, ATP-binding protein CcmA [Chloroflexi bacterium RBG_13_52_14]|nr:MAG: heme ABC exporter, ATP-binding protein CcmA [Chloroflexi bacterium RBG_13_52_14]